MSLPTITSEALACEIARLHIDADEKEFFALNAISDLTVARVNVATLAEKAKAELGQGYHKWWRDNGLADGWDGAYIVIAKRKQRFFDDPKQLLMFGAGPAESDGAQQMRRVEDRAAWIKSVGKLRASLTTERIDEMTRDERIAARMHLEPLVELYNKLEGGA